MIRGFMNITDAISFLDKQVPNPSKGLTKELFHFISRITPMVNVDLLIKDEKGRTLLSWRDDSLHKPSWHVPGGVIRFKEKMEERLQKVAEKEIGTIIEFEHKPIAINEMIIKRKIRGHFISFLYKCYLPSNFIPENKGLKENDAGYLMWHESCPDNLIKCHEVYREYM